MVKMESAAKTLGFEQARIFRDQIVQLRTILEED
jgi:excinuclease UvrABC nuclease subunit